MNYIIGMDGGGTKTDCILADSGGRSIYECTGGPSNFLLIGVKEASKNIFRLIKECVNKLKIKYGDIDIILLGTAGAGRKKDVKKFETGLKKYLKEKKVHIKKIRLESDAQIALEAAFPGEPGCILIAGTGSIIMGKDSDGNIYRAGGFGRYLGDEGGGYVLGRKALAAAAKEYDGRGASTIITQLLREKFQINSAEDLIDEIYHKEFDVASAAPLLLTAAELNDAAALKIIDEEIEELNSLLKAMLDKIKIPGLNVALSGSLLDKENIYSGRLKEKIKQIPSIVLKNSQGKPAMGAVLLAKSYLQKKKKSEQK